MTTPTAEQLDAITARLERISNRLGIVDLEPSPHVPVNPDGTPGNVVTGELIESAWGNAVVDTLQRGDIYSRFNQAESYYRGEMMVLCRSASYVSDASGFVVIPFDFPAGAGFVGNPTVVFTSTYTTAHAGFTYAHSQPPWNTGFALIVMRTDGVPIGQWGISIDYIAIGRRTGPGGSA